MVLKYFHRYAESSAEKREDSDTKFKLTNP